VTYHPRPDVGMYRLTRLAAVGALLAGVVFYGVVLRFAEGGDPTGPILWAALTVAAVTFYVLRRNLSFEIEGQEE